MAKALSVESETRRTSGWVLVLFGVLFTAAGGIALCTLTIQPLLGVYVAVGWREQPCRVLFSELDVHRDSEGDSYKIDIKYAYTVGGFPYVGDSYSFISDVYSGSHSGQQKVIRQYPKGANTVCYVDPADPESAVLNRSLTWDYLWGLFPIPFLAVGIGAIICAIRRKSEDSEAQRISSAGFVPRELDQMRPLPDAAFVDYGPVELKPETTPGKSFIGLTIAAIFWNGIVSVFLFAAHDAGWFMKLFMVPFVLIGIALVFGVINCFIALFNPRPKLTLSHPAIPPGGDAQLKWRFHGSSNAIRRLTITLKGEEKAEYIRGTDVSTDTETFFEYTLCDAEGYQPEITEGAARIEIPAEAMHSFKSKNNEILWSIVLDGDIPLRPDVNAIFPITVRPHDA